MKIDEARLHLLDRFESRTGFSTETKMRCEQCGKMFWVNTGTVADKFRKREKCGCSACGKETLWPVEIVNK